MSLNIEKQMKAQLSDDILNALKLCSQTAAEHDFKIYLIGGIVRDLLLKRKSIDIDVTVEGDAVKFCHLLVEKNYCKILQVQSELKTAKAVFNGDVEIDFASTRQEFYPHRGHLPVVVKIGCSLQEDVYRRDFTINSLAMSLNKQDYGNVIDYVGGIKDLNNKKIRVLHDNSFNEDPSRILRALKFAARFNFHRDAHTKALQEKYITTQRHKDISWTRIKSELKQCFSLNSAKVYDMFLVNENYKLIYGRNPEIKGLEIKTLVDKYNPYYVWLVYLGTILNDANIIEQFCFTRSEKKIFNDIEYLMNNHLSMMNSNYDIYKFFAKRTTESIIVYYLLTQRKEALKYLENLSLIRVELNGDEIKAMGIQNGREIGEILDEILKKKLNGTITKKSEEIEFVKSKIK